MKLIYFISPVASDPEYRDKRAVLAEIALECGVEFFFPLDRNSSFSVEVTVQDLRRSWLAIADLSLERPSCYFEVGLAQGIGVPLAFLAAENSVLHQAGDIAELLRYSSLQTYRKCVRELLAHRMSSVSL